MKIKGESAVELINKLMLQTREISSSLVTPTRRKLRTCLICFVMMMGMLHWNQKVDKKMSDKFM
jgi:hypothetical protein